MLFQGPPSDILQARCFSALSEAERDAITAVVFVGTFFVTFGVGRFLKRRAGVRLGLLYAFLPNAGILCCDKPFTASMHPGEITVGARVIFVKHGAGCCAREPICVGPLLRKRSARQQFRIFSARLFGGIIFLIVLLLVLSYGYHAEAQLKGVLAGSGVVAIILGFAGQNFFSGIIGGVAIQINSPLQSRRLVAGRRPLCRGNGESTGVRRGLRAPTMPFISTSRTNEMGGPYHRQSPLSNRSPRHAHSRWS